MGSFLPALAVIVAVVAWSHVALSESADVCLARVNELGDEKIVMIPREPTGGHGVALHACGIVDAPPATVWPVVRDCEKWAQYMPGVGSSKLEKRTGNTAMCEVIVDLPYPFSDLRSVASIVEIERPDGGFSRRSLFLEGNYKHNNGYWIVLPYEDGKKTLLVYDIDFNPDMAVPDFLLRSLQSRTAPDIFSAIRERVKLCSTSGQSCRAQ